MGLLGIVEACTLDYGSVLNRLFHHYAGHVNRQEIVDYLRRTKFGDRLDRRLVSEFERDFGSIEHVILTKKP